MKKYHRESKKWVSAEEYEKLTKKSQKDKDMCTKKLEHDYLLVLPEHYTYTKDYKFNPEELYKLLEKEIEFEEQIEKSITDLGVVSRYGKRLSTLYARKVRRMYMCSKCNKKKYE